MPSEKQIEAFARYRRKQIAELRPYIEGEDVSRVSISPEDAKAGSPRVGDMIARNPKNYADQWLVARAYFYDNFEDLTAAEQAQEAQPVGVMCLNCNSSWSDDRLVHEREINPKLLSCCPERKSVPVYTSPTIPEGWMLVPKEPTLAMLNAPWDGYVGTNEDYPVARGTWRAMLAAAPKPKDNP